VNTERNRPQYRRKLQKRQRSLYIPREYMTSHVRDELPERMKIFLHETTSVDCQGNAF